MLKLRNINKEAGSVSVNTTNSFNRKIIDESSDNKGQHSREIKKEYALKLQKRNKLINDVNGEDIYFYRRLSHGRTCSCFDGFSTPSADCPICFKSGVVGGYLKYGTHQNILDTTAPNVTLINMHHSLEMQLRPLNFILDDNALKGSILFNFDILQNNYRIIDTINFLYYADKNASVKIYVKTPSENSYILADNISVASRLNAEILNFKIDVTRKHVDVPTPKISHYWLRYLILESCVLPLDISRSPSSTSLDEMGTIKNSQAVQAFFDNRLGYVETEDFIYRLEDNEIWKPTEHTKKRSVGINTSTDVTLRIVQDFEAIRRFPI